MTYMPNQMNPTTETTHHGKTGRLPRNLLEELNLWFESGEAPGSILPWLNTLPEAPAVLASGFGGGQINEQNLSNLRKGGYLNSLNPGSR